MFGVLIGGLFAFLFAGLLLALVLGGRRIEDELNERAREARKIRVGAARVPRFLVVNRPTGSRVGRVDEALLWRVQQYLEAEQMLADKFVLQPSIENLYRESDRSLRGH
jgi:hypothetical protein